MIMSWLVFISLVIYNVADGIMHNLQPSFLSFPQVVFHF